MYFPYVRGKQFELLALRNMASLMAMNNGKISPIIEPVKKVSAPLERCLGELIGAEVNFNIIMNPSVGDLTKEYSAGTIIAALKSSLRGYQNYQLAFLIDSDKSWDRVKLILKEVSFPYGGITLIHNYQCVDITAKLRELSGVKYNLINYNTTSRRYHRSFPDYTKISLDDYFNAKAKNADYSALVDEVFSDEYKYFDDEGFSGFSDYLTLGANYIEGGFMPRAIAIHLTYLGDEEAIKVRHFVCDSIDDYEDTAGKFREALYKLINWLSTVSHSTGATKEFSDLHTNKHFPGLGTIKRLSIENHIELVLQLI